MIWTRVKEEAKKKKVVGIETRVHTKVMALMGQDCLRDVHV